MVHGARKDFFHKILQLSAAFLQIVFHEKINIVQVVGRVGKIQITLIIVAEQGRFGSICKTVRQDVAEYGLFKAYILFRRLISLLFQIAGFFNVLYGLYNLIFITGLKQIVPDPKTHGLFGIFEFTVTGENDKLDILSGIIELFNQLKT